MVSPGPANSVKRFAGKLRLFVAMLRYCAARLPLRGLALQPGDLGTSGATSTFCTSGGVNALSNVAGASSNL